MPKVIKKTEQYYERLQNRRRGSSSSGGGGVDEETVRDIVGSTLVAGTNVTITVNDALDTITISATDTDTNTTDFPAVMARISMGV